MGFPATRWNVVDSLKGLEGDARSAALGEILATYGPPLLAFALRRRRASTKEDCEDLVHDYFLRCIRGGLLEQADRSRGRFRTFLLASFKHFASNVNRAKSAQKRAPEGGFVSLELLIEQFGFSVEPKTRETPEAAFERTLRWVLFQRALGELQERGRAAGNDLKYSAFCAREIEPTRTAKPTATYAALAAQFGTSENAVNKAVLAARAELEEIVKQLLISDGLTDDEIDVECRLILATVLGR